MARPFRILSFAVCTVAVAVSATAEVVKLTVEQRQPLANAKQPYEKLTGRFYGELDPRLPQNAIITDIELAPRNARGMVEYSATFTVLKPTDMSKATGVLVYQVPNRGRANIEGGNYFADFRAAGHVLVASGWQADIAAGAGVETMVAPIARGRDGSSITGPVMARFYDAPAGATTQPIIRGRVTGTATPASFDTTKATLTRRTSEDGARVPIASNAWAFADCAQTPFPGKPDSDKLCLKDGFDSASLYELTYVAKDPPVHGIGFAATRDLIAFLRRHDADHPLGASVRYAIAQGNSQSGTYLRSFLNLGFNQDERKRRVFDGVNPNIAARQLAMNIRFAAPSGAAEMFEPGSEGALWWEDYTDTARSRHASGLLARCRASDTCPKIVETFGSAEFYSLRLSPNFVGTRADKDIPLPANVRRYYSPSTRHGGGAGGFAHELPVDACCMLATNPNPSNETNRALMKALVDWVVSDTAPPPSRYPTLAKGDLVPPGHASTGFPVIPGQPLPDDVFVPLYDYDFGPTFKYADVSGVMTSQPPAVRQVLPQLVPKVDADGNELAGIRSVLLEVPLGTYTGWNPIARGFFKGQIQALGGGYIPFAKTKAQRLASGDPRLSLEERYQTHEAYVAKVKEAARRQVAEGFLLQDDADRMVAQADQSNVTEMKTAVAALCLSAALAWPSLAAAQNLVIVNARVIDGKGGVMERGSVAVRDGKIVSISVSPPAGVAGAPRIDAQGLTLMPGFIDAHRHIVQGDGKEWLAKTATAQLQEFLDAGFTTVLCAICPDEALEMRQRIEAGSVKGPRLLLGSIIPVARAAVPGGGRGDPARFDTSRPPLRPTTPAGAIPDADIVKAVESVAARKYDYIKTVITTTPGGPETRTLKLIVDEGKKRNLPTITHAVSVIDTLAAVEAMPAVLVHTPHIGRLEEDAAAVKRIAGAGIPMTSTLQVFVPHFGADNTPLFRDAQPFPWDTISSAGQGPVNARLLWQAGISYGYGTDTTWPPKQSLADELRALSLVFSPRDITKIMGQGAARSTLKSDLIGTLDVGKQADLVLIDGNPLATVTDLLKVVTTIKGGRIVSDRREAAGRR